MHLRSQDTPQQFLNAVYYAKGWVDLAQDYKDYQAAIASAQGNRFELYKISQAWKTVTTAYGQSNPIWLSEYKDPTKSVMANHALSDLQAMQQQGKLNGPQAAGIADLLASYNDYHGLLGQQMVNGRKLPGYNQLQSAWYNYLDQEMTNNPALTNVISGVFRRVS